MDCEHNNSSKSRRSLVEEAFHACIGEHDASLRVRNETPSSILLEANGRLIELLLPASICMHQEETHSNKDNDVFVVIGLEFPTNDPLQLVLNNMNERLERIPPTSSSLGLVFQSLLDALHMTSSDIDIDNPAGIKAIGEDEYGDDEDLNRSLTCIDEHMYDLGDHLASRTSLYRNVEETSYAASCLQAIRKELINVAKGIKVEAEKQKNNDQKDSVHFFGREENSNKEVPILGRVRISLPNEREIWKWRVRLDPILFKNYLPLYGDMANYARDHEEGSKVAVVELEFIFPPDYPFSPPFVRVVSPRFLICTGHVAEAGAVCMELLSESGWNPTHSFESVLVQIVNAIIDQRGRLDTTAAASDSPAMEYTETNAREVFKQLALDYGWVKSSNP